MCGRYAIFTAPHKLVDLFGLTGCAAAKSVTMPAHMSACRPRYNAAPLQSLLVIVHNRLGFARWGLLPSWAAPDDHAACAKTVNARAESVAEKPAFADSWHKRRRCLVPADGFYEWVTDGTGRKNPFYIHRNDKEVMGFAGLWAKRGALVTFTILTKPAAAPVDALHHRMPVMLRPEQAAAWFAADEATARTMIANADAAALQYHPVDHAVGKVANDSANLITKQAMATLF